VLPTAISIAPASDELMGALTSSAASVIAGHSRTPNDNKATTAIPVGGQMGVTTLPTKATRRLNLAVR
jgi:hypothetical protein